MRPPSGDPQNLQICLCPCRLRNSDGWSGVWGLLFQRRSVMGRLWDDHFRDLGHPPKFYRVQDAGFIGGSLSWWQIRVIFIKNNWKITKNNVFSPKWPKTTKKTAGMLATEVRSGDAPKPQFSMKTYKKCEKSGNQPQINHICPYFWVCVMFDIDPFADAAGLIDIRTQIQ